MIGIYRRSISRTVRGYGRVYETGEKLSLFQNLAASLLQLTFFLGPVALAKRDCRRSWHFVSCHTGANPSVAHLIEANEAIWAR